MNRIRVEWILKPSSLRSTVIVQVLVGWVFVSEGIQKFLFPAVRGAGRFAKIGLPAPDVLGPFVGSVEIICGLLVLMGLATRLAAIPLLIIMTTAILTTKVPMGLEQGFWQMAHAARTDVSMFLGSLFLLINGAGPVSLDALLLSRLREMNASSNNQTPSVNTSHD